MNIIYVHSTQYIYIFNESISGNHANVQIFVCEERTNFDIDLNV